MSFVAKIVVFVEFPESVEQEAAEELADAACNVAERAIERLPDIYEASAECHEIIDEDAGSGGDDGDRPGSGPPRDDLDDELERKRDSLVELATETTRRCVGQDTL